jgi:putative endonuclease
MGERSISRRAGAVRGRAPSQRLGASSARIPPGLDRRGEDAAVAFAQARGARVAARNWRGGGGEIDLVLHDGRTLVFAEVKTRSSDACGGPVAAVTAAKIRKVSRAALAYLQENELLDRAACRFDVFAVAATPGAGLSVEWIKDAFQAPES